MCSDDMMCNIRHFDIGRNLRDRVGIGWKKKGIDLEDRSGLRGAEAEPGKGTADKSLTSFWIYLYHDIALDSLKSSATPIANPPP